MRTMTRTALPLAALALAVGAPAASATSAHSGDGEWKTYTAHLTQLNDSGASGTAWISLSGDQAKVKITSQGLLKGAPHAQHIHIGAKGTCPTNGQKGTGANGALRVKDAMPQYGMIGTSLTTSGDTSPNSGLAVDRFPTGSGTYERTFDVSDDVAQNIRSGKAVVVLHGVDLNGNGTYDGESKSELDPKLPEEATDPAACGALKTSQMNQMPSGGVQTGTGQQGSSQNMGMIAGGSAAAVAGAGLVVLARRRRTAGAQD